MTREEAIEAAGVAVAKARRVVAANRLAKALEAAQQDERPAAQVEQKAA